MALNELLDELEIPLNQRLQQLSYPQLLSIVDVLTKRMRIQDLAQLVADKQHFTLKNLFRTLERLEDGTLLLQILNEPFQGQRLHRIIEHWLQDQELQVHRLQTIEPNTIILGWKDVGYGGRSFTRMWQSKEIWAIEANLKRSQNAINHAFSQAMDLVRRAQYCYVTISPYVWYKFSEIIRKKIESSKNLGMLLVDRSRVKVLVRAQRNNVEKDQYNKLKSAIE